MTHDPVNTPSHYTRDGGIECIDALESALTAEQASGFRRGNAMKYVWRAGRKGSALEDLRKAEWYLKREISTLEAANARAVLGAVTVPIRVKGLRKFTNAIQRVSDQLKRDMAAVGKAAAALRPRTMHGKLSDEHVKALKAALKESNARPIVMHDPPAADVPTVAPFERCQNPDCGAQLTAKPNHIVGCIEAITIPEDAAAEPIERDDLESVITEAVNEPQPPVEQPIVRRKTKPTPRAGTTFETVPTPPKLPLPEPPGADDADSDPMRRARREVVRRKRTPLDTTPAKHAAPPPITITPGAVPDGYMRIRDAMKAWGKAEPTIYAHAAAGKIHSVKINGAKWFAPPPAE